MDSRHPSVVRIGSSFHEAAALEPLNHPRDRRCLDAESGGERCLTKAWFVPYHAEQRILSGVHTVRSQKTREVGPMAPRKPLQRPAERSGHAKQRSG